VPVVTIRCWPVLVLVASIVAFGTTAPELSVTVPKDKTYPADLTKAEWKKKKKVGSVGGEPSSIYVLAQNKINTGLGEALDQAQKAWAAIPFKKLSRRSADMEHDDGWREPRPPAPRPRWSWQRAGT